MALALLIVSLLLQLVSSFQLIIDSTSSRPQSHYGVEADVTRKLKVVDRTVDRTVATVENVVDLVNQTAQKIMIHGLSTRQGLSSAFLEAKTNAVSLHSVLGEDISSSGEQFFERLGETLEAMPEQMAQSDAKMQSIFRDVVLQFRTFGNSSKDLFDLAAASVSKLSGLHSLQSKKEQAVLLEINEVAIGSAEMAERTEAEGIVEWFIGTFGRGNTPCGQARVVVSDAEKSVDHMSRMLLQLNTTFCSNLLEGAVNSIKETHLQVKQVMKTGASTYAVKLPGSLLSTVASTVDATGEWVDRMHSKVAEFESKVTGAIRLAIQNLATLHEVSGTLSAGVDAACID